MRRNHRSSSDLGVLTLAGVIGLFATGFLIRHERAHRRTCQKIFVTVVDSGSCSSAHPYNSCVARVTGRDDAVVVESYVTRGDRVWRCVDRTSWYKEGE